MQLLQKAGKLFLFCLRQLMTFVTDYPGFAIWIQLKAWLAVKPFLTRCLTTSRAIFHLKCLLLHWPLSALVKSCAALLQLIHCICFCYNWCKVHINGCNSAFGLQLVSICCHSLAQLVFIFVFAWVGFLHEFWYNAMSGLLSIFSHRLLNDWF